ncbi:hypothetical protein SAMN02800692_0193 [Luteibacter sp. UNC138MFCol5.1]|uniref:hypothetical protein n=1 Tax=Luteibacter sp. UNC138MFCol5.1 TaxID=1502774 RepID=UPI0008CF90DB|nr:hypothetical protein [Luteibacter sp. UNC138MFCol5.1]SEO31643.1 hypothetical protein SAMN02800692_0193 [Luteibacter sp. UNC138MFCol5.1]
MAGDEGHTTPLPAGTATFRIQSGRVVVQRLVDVADTIDLGAVRGRTSSDEDMKAAPGDRIVDLEPLAVVLGYATWPAGSRGIEGHTTARLYEFGVAALSFSCEIVDLDWDGLLSLVDALNPVAATGWPAGVWNPALRRLLDTCGVPPRRDEHLLAEEHLMVVVTATAGRDAPDDTQLARLLSGDAGELSGPARERLLEHRYSHHADDLLALGASRSYMQGAAWVPGMTDVLEAAHARVLELRFYNTLLYDELPRMYALVARAHERFAALAPRRMATLARRLYTLVGEVTELMEKLDTSIEVPGSPHLAMAYAKALELLQVPALGSAVDRKLAIVRDTYAALYDEAAASRAGLLELIIIALIALEIAMTIARW